MGKLIVCEDETIHLGEVRGELEVSEEEMESCLIVQLMCYCF